MRTAAAADGLDDARAGHFIMLITRCPTDPRAVIEFTNWNEVEAFGRRVAQV